MSNSMHHDFRGQRPAGPLTPPSEDSGSPFNSSPQPPRLRRTNAIRRVDMRTARQRREELLRLRSPTRVPRVLRRSLSIADLTTRYQQDMNANVNTHPHVDANVNVNVNANRNTNNGNDSNYWRNFVDYHAQEDEREIWTFDQMRRFLDTLASLVTHGIPADELGRYICLLVYGKDRFLGEIVTQSVNTNSTYEQIAIRLLKTFDLRDNNGDIIYLQLQPAEDPNRKPNRPLRYQENRKFQPRQPLGRDVLSYENMDTNGPLLIYPKSQVGRPTSAIQERILQDFFVESESNSQSPQAQIAPVPAQASNEQANKVDEGQVDSDNYSDMVDEDDDVRMLDPNEEENEELFDSSERIDNYAAQNPQIHQAQVVQYTRPTSPPRFYAEINAEKRRQAARRSDDARSSGVSRRTIRSNGQANRRFNVRFPFS